MLPTHLITYELPQIAPAPGTNPCGNIAATHDSVNRDTVTHGMMYHQWDNLEESLSLSTLKQSVHSWRQFMTTLWTQSTTCRSLPSLGQLEEYALLTYNVLIHPHHTETLTVNILWYYISQHIMYTWDRQLEPTSMDLRWQDSTCSCRRYLCTSKWAHVDWSSSWTSSSLDWRPRIWDLTAERSSTIHFPKSAIHHALELPWGTPKPQHAAISPGRKKARGACWFFQPPKSQYFITCSLLRCRFVAPLYFTVNPQLLASVFNMTRRDSVFAGIDSPRVPMSMPRRHSHLHGHSSSGAASSDDRYW